MKKVKQIGKQDKKFKSEPSGTRTQDQQIKSLMLYQLS